MAKKEKSPKEHPLAVEPHQLCPACQVADANHPPEILVCGKCLEWYIEKRVKEAGAEKPKKGKK